MYRLHVYLATSRIAILINSLYCRNTIGRSFTSQSSVCLQLLLLVVVVFVVRIRCWPDQRSMSDCFPFANLVRYTMTVLSTVVCFCLLDKFRQFHSFVTAYSHLCDMNRTSESSNRRRLYTPPRRTFKAVALHGRFPYLPS